MNEKIRDETSKKGISFWLDLDSKAIFQRIKVNMKRPLLNNITSESEIEKFVSLEKQFTHFLTSG